MWLALSLVFQAYCIYPRIDPQHAVSHLVWEHLECRCTLNVPPKLSFFPLLFSDTTISKQLYCSLISSQAKHTHTHTPLCDVNRCIQQAKLKKPVSSVPVYFDFYWKDCVSVCLEKPMAVPAQPPVNTHPRGVMDTHVHTYAHTSCEI